MRLGIITRNFGWKAGSLLLAVLLWIAFSTEPDIVTEHTVPILYRGLRTQFLVTGDSPNSIEVEVRGPADRLTASNLADTVVLLDVSNVDAPGERTITIGGQNLNLPREVSFLRAVPSQLRLRFARMATKDVPVEIRYVGTLPPGLRLVAQSVEPKVLRVVGAENRVDSVNTVETDAIVLDRLTRSGSLKVNAFVNDPQVRFDSSPVVTVRVTVDRTGQ
ncbi:MAG: CdaR family protein [Bryobacteraceae bacterium]